VAQSATSASGPTISIASRFSGGKTRPSRQTAAADIRKTEPHRQARLNASPEKVYAAFFFFFFGFFFFFFFFIFFFV